MGEGLLKFQCKSMTVHYVFDLKIIYNFFLIFVYYSPLTEVFLKAYLTYKLLLVMNVTTNGHKTRAL